MVLTRNISWLLPRCAGALLVLAVSVHSANATGMLMFEDLWPSNGDRDFNDVVVAYNYVYIVSNGKVTGMQATFNPLALGASIHNGIYLHLPVPANAIASATLNLGQGAAAVTPVGGESQAVIPIVADTRSLFPGATGLINTDSTLPFLTSPTIQLDIQFVAAAPPLTGQAPFDLFIARTGDYGHQIHQSQYGGTDLASPSLFNTFDDASSAATGRYYVNGNGIPFVLNIPQVIAWPVEHVAIEAVYPDIVSFFASGGTQHTDWYLTNVNQALVYSPVPEPASLLLLGFATTALVARRRK